MDDGKHIISDNDDDASINFDDFGSDKEGDFGSYRCVFWVNNDCDCTHWETDRLPSMGWHEDDFGNNINCLDDTIGCRLLFTNGFHHLTDIQNFSINDLEDFNRLHVLLDTTFQKLSKNGAAFEFRISNAPINIFHALSPGLDYLKSVTEANEQAELRRLLELTPTTGQVIPGKYLKFDGSISPFIWEGCAPGIYDLELSVSTKPANGKPGEFIGTRRVRLVLRDISEYFDTWDASSQNNNINSKPFFKDGKQQTDEYILFVHGFNVLNSEKIFWPGTMQKRLWWNGYRGRTGIFTWNCSLVNITEDLRKLKFNLHVYDQSELKAWQTGANLKDVLLKLQNQYGGGKVSVLAHSQGNIVTSEALRLMPEGNAIHAYIASQGAISSSCFQHIDKPYFLEKEYREKEHGFLPWLVTPDVCANYPGWNLLSPRVHPPYLHSMLSTPKASKMINYFNPDDWALTGAMETSWEDNNAMKPNLGFGYAGDKSFYNVFIQYNLNFFYKGHLAQSGTVLKFPDMSENHRSAHLEDTHTIFSFIVQAWGRPIGTNDKTTCFDKHSNLQEINFGGNHY
ncbi:MAG: alpha/beta hydrolase, partial [Victivallales bacterium]|nr:alpha/beta hydrolase [Victivallales bacterium]